MISESANFLIATCSGVTSTQENIAATSVDSSEKEEYGNIPISHNAVLYRYLTANEEDFLDEFPRLPPEVNPLDARFTDPRVLAGEVQPDIGRAFGFGGEERGQGGLWGGLQGEW